MNTIQTPLHTPVKPLALNNPVQDHQTQWHQAPAAQLNFSADGFAVGQALKAQVQTSLQPSHVQAPHFGALKPYDGKYNNAVIFTDFNDGASNQEAVLQFQDTLQWVQEKREEGQLNNTNQLNGFTLSPWAKAQDSDKTNTPRPVGFLDVQTFADTPSGNRDYSAFTIQRLAGRSNNQDIFVHVTDPGVGNAEAHDRSILVTENHGVVIGPNNGSLGLLLKFLKEKNEKHTLYPIDIKKAQHFETFRWNNPNYVIPESFHARDLFVVVGAAIAGGIDPSNFVDEQRTETFEPKFNPFAQEVKPFPTKLGEKVDFYAFQDQTYGNIKTNLTLTHNGQRNEPAQLIEENAQYTLTNKTTGKTLENVPYKRVFADVPLKNPLTYLGSTYASTREDGVRFVELARHFDSISASLGLELGESQQLTIQRTQ